MWRKVAAGGVVAVAVLGLAASVTVAQTAGDGRMGTTAGAASTTTAPARPGATVGRDVLVLADGTRLEGTVRRDGDAWQVETAEGASRRVPPEEVGRIDLAPRADATAGDAALASLRRSSEALGDPRRVVERYRQFIEMHRGQSVADDAELDLRTWTYRLEKGLIRLGGAWVTSGQADRLRSDATDLALRAVGELREGRLQAAEQTLADALAMDPGNPTAHYLRGVVLYRQDRLPEARRAFEASLESAPGHGPTLGNLAVTLYRTNAVALAMATYDQALTVMPLERGLLSNVAEALHALTDAQRNNPAARRVQRKFDEQEKVLSERLARLPPPEGPLFRWGSSWVTQQQLDEYRAAEARIQAELDQLAGEYDQTVARISGIDEQIRRNLDDMRRIELQSYGTDASGNPVRFPLPQIYFQLRNQTEQLRAERASVEARQAQLRARARAVQGQMPAPRFTGIQQLYAAEAAPVVRRFAPTTRPR